MDKENTYIIYKAQNNENGYIYIGATTKEIKTRKLDHLQKSNANSTIEFHQAIYTYGSDAFTWEQVDTAQSNDELALKEKQYIYQYNSQENGYNNDQGGGFRKTVYKYSLKDGSFLEQFECLNDAGVSVNSTKKQISKACLSVNNIHKGYYWNYEFIEPFKSKYDKRNKEVFQMDNNGNIISKFKSVKLASVETSTNKTSIAKVCRGERKSAGGYYWKYV